MTDENRKLLCRSGGVFTREAVYQIPDGLEVDTSEHYEIVRRRVFFEDVHLVTYHSDRGVWYLVITGLWGALFIAMGLALLAANLQAWPASITFFVMGLPAALMFLVRLTFGRDVITVFGRRSKAVMRFSALRRNRAREIYGQICATVRRVQAAAAAATAVPAAAPLSADVPMPPEG